MNERDERSWRNCWKTDDSACGWVHYVYVDRREYLADSLFAQAGIRVHFKKEMIKEESPYCIVFCKVKKKEEMRFLQAVERLKNNMLLLGHDDYPEICKWMSGLMEKERQNKKEQHKKEQHKE